MFLWPDALPDANPISRFLRHAGIRCTYSNRGTHRDVEIQTNDKPEQVKSFNTARVVKQMSTLMLKHAIYAFSVEKQQTNS